MSDSTILAQTLEAANQAAASASAAAQAEAALADKAPLVSPALTGTPTAPTPTQSDNSTKLATTAYLDRLLGVAGGVPTLDATGKIPVDQIPQISVVSVYLAASQTAMLALAASSGDFCIRTDLSNAVYVLQQLPASTLGNWYEIGTSPVLSVAGLTGAISADNLTAQLNPVVGDTGSGGTAGTVPAPAAGDAAAGKFLKANGAFEQIAVADLSGVVTGSGNLVLSDTPVFTGAPAAPTAPVDTNTGQIATTEFVLGQVSAVGDGVPAVDGTAARGTSTHFARADHVHPTDTTRAPLNSPVFTGTPAAPTQPARTRSTTLATCAYVDAACVQPGDIVVTLDSAVRSGFVELDGSTITGGVGSYPEVATRYTWMVSGADLVLPDMRGRFLRSWAHGSANDPDRASRTARVGDGLTGDNVGTYQDDQYRSHTHSYTASSANQVSGNSGSNQGGSNAGASTGASGGNETRPININVMFQMRLA